MASKELIIDDDYCQAMGKYFEKRGKQMDEIISDYIAILQDVKNGAITQGDVSKSLNAYISYVQQLKQKIGNISTSTKTGINNFLVRVDTEDQYLF